MVALDDRVTLRRFGAHAPIPLKVRFADADAQLIGLLRVVADHQVKIGIKAGRAAAEGLRAVRVGKDVVAVAVALDDRERRVQRHPVDEVRELAQPAARRGQIPAVAQDHTGEIPLPRRRLSDEIPVAHRFTGAQQKPVEPRTGEAEIRHLVALELHVDVLELSHERRMVGKRLIC